MKEEGDGRMFIIRHDFDCMRHKEQKASCASAPGCARGVGTCSVPPRRITFSRPAAAPSIKDAATRTNNAVSFVSMLAAHPGQPIIWTAPGQQALATRAGMMLKHALIVEAQ